MLSSRTECQRQMQLHSAIRCMVMIVQWVSWSLNNDKRRETYFGEGKSISFFLGCELGHFLCSCNNYFYGSVFCRTLVFSRAIILAFLNTSWPEKYIHISLDYNQLWQKSQIRLLNVWLFNSCSSGNIQKYTCMHFIKLQVWHWVYYEK